VSIVDALYFIQTSRFAHAIAESNHLLVAGLQMVHVFGFIFLLAPLILICLRVVGLVLRDQPLENVVRQSRRLSWLGLAMTLTSGALMFLSAPLHYYNNWAFDTKMLLLLTALLFYALLFFWVAARESVHPTLAKISVALSLLSWIAVCMAGRAIGFV
jgi:uncharacterized protein DUF6644